MDAPELPLTRAGARTWALAQAADRGVAASEVSSVPHEELEDDPVSGGFALRYGRTLLVALRDGAHASHLDPGDGEARRALLDRVLAQAQARNRVLSEDDLGPHQRAALAAIRAGVRRVAALDAADRPGVGPAELPGAEWLLAVLARWHRDHTPTYDDALAHLRRYDDLLRAPDGDARVHPCPLCQAVAPWTADHPRTVCWACHDRARCVHRRAVGGRRTTLGGPLSVVHPDDGSVCEEVACTGLVTVDGAPCRLDEARPGGVVVQALPTGSDLVADHSESSVVAAIAERARLLALVSGLAPRSVPDHLNRDGGHPFVRVRLGVAVYAARDRGRVVTEERFTSVAELLREVMGGVTRDMAFAWELGHRRPGEDSRRQAFAAWVGLMTLLDPAWGEATAAAVEAVLGRAPYRDPA